MNAKTSPSIIRMLTMRMGYGDAEIDNFFDESDNYLNMAMGIYSRLPASSCVIRGICWIASGMIADGDHVYC